MVSKKKTRNSQKDKDEMTGFENPLHVYETWLGSLIALLIASMLGIVNFQCLTSDCMDGLLLVNPQTEFFIILMTIFIGFIVGWITHVITNAEDFKKILFKR